MMFPEVAVGFAVASVLERLLEERTKNAAELRQIYTVLRAFRSRHARLYISEIEFEIECCPRHQRCLVCRLEFTVRDYDFQCPQCGNLQTEYVSGDQLELVYLEVEEHEPSSVRAQSS